MKTWRVVGIDPAPSKCAAIWQDGRCEKCHPRGLRSFVEEQIAAADNVLIAWDAPLSYDSQYGYYERPVDRAVGRYLKAHPTQIEPGAVSVRPFAGCPHWVVTCDALGFPHGNPPKGLRQIGSADSLDGETGPLVIEVHPAVSIALWWIEAGVDRPMPRYKIGREVSKQVATANRRMIVEVLAAVGCPHDIQDDDALDAWVAWKMGRDLVAGNAYVAGDVTSGLYVLPLTKAAAAEIDPLLDKARNELRKSVTEKGKCGDEEH